MAVLIESYALVIKRSSILQKHIGGIKEFEKNLQNFPYCADNELYAVHFAKADDLELFTDVLILNSYSAKNPFTIDDFALVDMIEGFFTNCDWLTFIRAPFFCHHRHFLHHNAFFTVVKLGRTEVGNEALTIQCPKNWNPDNAVYGIRFLCDEDRENNLEFVEEADGSVTIYSTETGRQVII